MSTKKQNRAVAVRAFIICQHNKQDGIAYFRDNVKGDYGAGDNIYKLMDKWHAVFEATGDVNESAHRTGRPPKTTDDEVQQCVQAFLSGYNVEEEGGVKVKRGFTSIQQAVESGHALKINEIVQKSGITIPSLWRRMLQLKPDLHTYKCAVDYKSRLSPAQKHARVLACAQLRRWPMKKLKRVIWMDAKKLYVTPGHLEVYTLDKDHVVEDQRLPPGSFNNGVKLYYYAGVNAEEGVVDFQWVTGCDEEPSRYTTYVSAPHLIRSPSP
jgi:hypothetical protein